MSSPIKPTAADTGMISCTPKICVLQSGKGKCDIIREIAHSGAQEEPFYVLKTIDDIICKHEE